MMSFSVLEEGPRVRITAECPDHNEGLFKAYLKGQTGRVLMGTLMPEQGKLRIVRTYSLDSLRRQGVWPLEDVEIALSFPAPSGIQDTPHEWRRVDDLSKLMKDPVLIQCAVSVQNALVKSRPDGFLVAIPLGGRFEFSPLFCFAQIEPLAGKQYSVFSFNEKGIPQMPHKTH